MAALPEVSRRRIWRGLMRWWSANVAESVNFTKADLFAAITDIDGFIDGSANQINNQFSEPFKSAASADQKALLFSVVALARYEPDLLRDLLRTEVD